MPVRLLKVLDKWECQIVANTQPENIEFGDPYASYWEFHKGYREIDKFEGGFRAEIGILEFREKQFD